MVLLDVKYVREIRHTGLEAMLIWVMVLDESSEAGSDWKGVFMYTGTWIKPFFYRGFLTGFPGEPAAESSHM